MEENFKAREAELERSVQQKKRFLWGLARSLRDQHEHMTRAMRDVRQETQRLSLKVRQGEGPACSRSGASGALYLLRSAKLIH